MLSSDIRTVFLSPNSSPWGNHICGIFADRLALKHDAETPRLATFAAVAFLQHLKGNRYSFESSAFADIFTHSPCKYLTEITFHISTLDKCACEGMLEGQKIRKRTHFQSNLPIRHFRNQMRRKTLPPQPSWIWKDCRGCPGPGRPGAENSCGGPGEVFQDCSLLMLNWCYRLRALAM